MFKFSSVQSAALVSVKAIAATLLIQVFGGGVAVAQAVGNSRVIEGIWDSTVTARDCASGAALGPPFKALIVFRRGGTFDVDPTQGHGLFGDIYGIWKHAAGAAYTANAVHLRFNPDGTYAGINKIQRSVNLSADAGSFTSSLAVQIFDLNGNVVDEVCPTEVAVRMNL